MSTLVLNNTDSFNLLEDLKNTLSSFVDIFNIKKNIESALLNKSIITFNKFIEIYDKHEKIDFSAEYNVEEITQLYDLTKMLAALFEIALQNIPESGNNLQRQYISKLQEFTILFLDWHKKIQTLYDFLTMDLESDFPDNFELSVSEKSWNKQWD